VSLGLAGLTALAVAAPTPGAADGCTRVIAPGEPVQTIVSRLRPGEVGCLADGLHAGPVRIRRDAITLRSVNQHGARLVGQVRIDGGADGVTISGLQLDGTNEKRRPSPLVNGDDARFAGNDVTNATETCFVLGDKTWGVANRTVIEGNVIHHCGIDGTNKDHGVYVRYAADTRIEGNAIRENPDRGVQLYPNADRTVVRANVIDRNGEGVIFSGDGADTSDGNVVEGNVIARSDVRWNVEAFWLRNRIGQNNAVRGNCIWGGSRGDVQQPQVGFATEQNTVGDEAACPIGPPVLW
jgi:nitrous oxidase accessory protein NosD